MPRPFPFPPRFCRWLLLGACLLGAGRAGAADGDANGRPRVGEGEPLVQFWSPRDFRGVTECPALAQDARGVIYVGNRGLILEYDGSTWRQIPLAHPGYVAGLAYDAGTDTVFVGTQVDLGFLRTEPGGAHTFVSLRDRLPADDRSVGDFWGVHATPEGVYFVGVNRVLRWRDGRFKTWRLPTTTNLRSEWVAGRLHVSSRDVGLLRLEGDEFVSASDDPLFRRAKVAGILANPDGSLLVATIREGLFTLRGRVVEPLTCEGAETLRAKGIVKILRLRDGSLALSTNTAELVLLDPAGRFRSRVDRFGGRGGGEIFRLFEDAEGGLWIGLQTGVARAEPDSPLSLLRAGPEDNLSSTYHTAPWGGTQVVGNNAGVFRLVPADPAAVASARLAHVPGTTRAAYGLTAVANGALYLTEGKIMFLDAGGKPSAVAGEITNAVSLRASRTVPGRVYVADRGGRVSRLRLDAATDRWLPDGVVADLGITGEGSVVETPRGDLWLGTSEHGLFRLQPDAAGGVKVSSFFHEAGPLRGVGFAFADDGGDALTAHTSDRLFRFDEAAGTFGPLAAFGAGFNDGSISLDEVGFHGADSLWVIAKNLRGPGTGRFTGRVLAGGAGRAPVVQPLPHRVEEVLGGVEIILPVEESPAPLRSVLVVGATGNGLVRLDVPRWEAGMRETPRPFATLIRRAFATTRGEGAGHAAPILGEPLDYARNTAHFEYAAGTLAFGAAPRFQTRLGGFGEGEWSEWSERTDVDYLHLPEGRYVFEVRARDADGRMGGVGSLAFRVLPPWQRSPWAYAGYALAAAGGVAALVNWRGRQLRQRNVALEALVDARTGELRGREAELVRARDDAETANRAKSAFLANMSHELRTPLNAVLGYAQLLLKQPDLSARSRERVTVIGQSGGHLLSLVNEVLDLSKVEAGKLTLSPFDFALGPLLDEVAAAFRPRLAEKGLAFTETRAPGLPGTVHTDPSRLRQVLFNLLSNAVKFTPGGGVTLSVRPTADGRGVRFEVADTGVGIAAGDQQNIFLAFYQAGDSRLSAQGTGLGLAISQRLVELLGGRIEVDSAPGQGSRFWFELPLVDVAAAAAGVAAPLAVAEVARGRVTGYEGGTRRLLLVDDVTENRRVLRDFLQPLGFEIEEAADGAGCLAACARQLPDAVLLDLRLGEMHGFTVARTLRTRLDGARLGIIAISASVFESDRQQAIDAGCDDFLPKPFEEAQLLGTLGRVLGLRWVRETPPVVAGVPVAPGGAETLPAGEITLLRELALRGDAAGLRRCLEAGRAEGTPGHAGELVRRLEALVAAYDMEAIHDLLLTLPPAPSHDGP